ncbi:MAG TPA: sigma-70 family RNA polymerase sigma factor, partial [Frankiaceae bacterium]|nr:sigma-70 family RNA polymerase sigma factor [Frankiaceae bacterium]
MGDERRWAAVCAHRERLLRIARARVDDPHDAEDCVQEAMLRCVEFADLDEERLGQFLTTVTVRLCADVHRGRARGERLASRLSAFWGTDPGPEDAVCDRAESAWLSGRLAALTPHQRQIVEARAEGLSCGAVADRLTVPYTTVESALARARRSLRAALDATLGIVPAPGWLRLRRLLAGGAVAAGALTFVGPGLPGGDVAPPAARP